MLLLLRSEEVSYKGEQYPIRRAVAQNFLFDQCLFDLKGDTEQGSALILRDGSTQYKVQMESTIFNRCKSKQGGSMYLSGDFIAYLKRVCISDCYAAESGGIMTSLLSQLHISYLSAVNCISQEKCLEIQGNPILNNLNISKCTVNKSNSFGINYAYGILFIYQNSQAFNLKWSTFNNNTSPCGIFYSKNVEQYHMFQTASSTRIIIQTMLYFM